MASCSSRILELAGRRHACALSFLNSLHMRLRVKIKYYARVLQSPLLFGSGSGSGTTSSPLSPLEVNFVRDSALLGAEDALMADALFASPLLATSPGGPLHPTVAVRSIPSFATHTAAHVAVAAAGHEATLRGFVLDAARTLTTLYARRAVTALMACLPHADAVQARSSSHSAAAAAAAATHPSDGAGAAVVVWAAAPPPPSSLHILFNLRDNGAVPSPARLLACLPHHHQHPHFAGATPPQRRSQYGPLVSLLKLMSWNGVAMPPDEVAAQAAAPHMNAVVDAIGARARATGVPHSLYRYHNPTLPDAAGVWRFDPSADPGAAPTHPLALVDGVLRSALLEETAGAAVALAVRAVAPRYPIATTAAGESTPTLLLAVGGESAACFPAWATKQGLPLAMALIRELEEELCEAARPAHREQVWRGQNYVSGGGEGSAINGGGNHFNGVPCAPAGLANITRFPGIWRDAESREQPNPEFGVWLSGVLLEAACGGRMASFAALPWAQLAAASERGRAGRPSDAASLGTGWKRGLDGPYMGAAQSSQSSPNVTSSAAAAWVARVPADVAAAVLADTPAGQRALPTLHIPAAAAGEEAPCFHITRVGVAAARPPVVLLPPPLLHLSPTPSPAPVSAPSPLVYLGVHAESGALNHAVSLAVANAWALALRSANAGLKERAARVLAGVLNEAIADVVAVDRALQAVLRVVAAGGAGPNHAADTQRLTVSLSAASFYRRTALTALLTLLPTERLGAAAAWRMELERTDAPVYSLYLAALLELQGALVAAEALCPQAPEPSEEDVAADAVAIAVHEVVQQARRELEALNLGEGGGEHGGDADVVVDAAWPPAAPLGEGVGKTASSTELPAVYRTAELRSGRVEAVVHGDWAGDLRATSDYSTDGDDAVQGGAATTTTTVAAAASSVEGGTTAERSGGSSYESPAAVHPAPSSLPLLSTASDALPSSLPFPPLPLVVAPWRLVAAGVGFSLHPGVHNGLGSGPLTSPSASSLGSVSVGDYGGVQWSGTLIQAPVTSPMAVAALHEALRSPASGISPSLLTGTSEAEMQSAALGRRINGTPWAKGAARQLVGLRDDPYNLPGRAIDADVRVIIEAPPLLPKPPKTKTVAAGNPPVLPLAPGFLMVEEAAAAPHPAFASAAVSASVGAKQSLSAGATDADDVQMVVVGPAAAVAVSASVAVAAASCAPPAASAEPTLTSATPAATSAVGGTPASSAAAATVTAAAAVAAVTPPPSAATTAPVFLPGGGAPAAPCPRTGAPSTCVQSSSGMQGGVTTSKARATATPPTPRPPPRRPHPPSPTLLTTTTMMTPMRLGPATSGSAAPPTLVRQTGRTGATTPPACPLPSAWATASLCGRRSCCGARQSRGGSLGTGRGTPGGSQA